MLHRSLWSVLSNAPHDIDQHRVTFNTPPRLNDTFKCWVVGWKLREKLGSPRYMFEPSTLNLPQSNFTWRAVRSQISSCLPKPASDTTLTIQSTAPVTLGHPINLKSSQKKLIRSSSKSQISYWESFSQPFWEWSIISKPCTFNGVDNSPILNLETL